MLDARCPECENVAKVNDDITKVTCPHCKFETTYDEQLTWQQITYQIDLVFNYHTDPLSEQSICDPHLGQIR